MSRNNPTNICLPTPTHRLTLSLTCSPNNNPNVIGRFKIELLIDDECLYRTSNSTPHLSKGNMIASKNIFYVCDPLNYK